MCVGQWQQISLTVRLMLAHVVVQPLHKPRVKFFPSPLFCRWYSVVEMLVTSSVLQTVTKNLDTI